MRACLIEPAYLSCISDLTSIASKALDADRSTAAEPVSIGGRISSDFGLCVGGMEDCLRCWVEVFLELGYSDVEDFCRLGDIGVC